MFPEAFDQAVPVRTPTVPNRVVDCDICGWVPAAPLKLNKVRALLIYWRTSMVRATVCRTCGQDVAREVQGFNLVRGWWGILALLVNLWTLAANSIRYRRHRRTVGPPVERNPGSQAYQSEPTKVAPLWRTPQAVLVPVLAIVLVAVAVPFFWDRIRPVPVAPGSCVSNLGTVVDCSRGSASYVITDKVASVRQCPPQKRGKAFGNDNFVLCVVPKPLPIPAP